MSSNPEFRQITTKYLLHISHTYAEINVIGIKT